MQTGRTVQQLRRNPEGQIDDFANAFIQLRQDLSHALNVHIALVTSKVSEDTQKIRE